MAEQFKLGILSFANKKTFHIPIPPYIMESYKSHTVFNIFQKQKKSILNFAHADCANLTIEFLWDHAIHELLSDILK
jgi:hypothetical protein